MKLLIVTQTVDENDPTLGFFCRWLTEFSKRVESIDVICLKEGKYVLPANVHVHSLGKEKTSTFNLQPSTVRKLAYTFRFLSLAYKLRNKYDTVLVHMNQEYVLIAGWLWKLLGKRVFMWRNHYAGSFLTDIAASFCVSVFCTSTHSYTAKFKNTRIMPVGVDLERFHQNGSVVRQPHSILFLARMAPSKHPELLLDALALLKSQGVLFSATFVGSPIPQDESYYASLKASATKKGIDSAVSFMPGVSNSEAVALYRAHTVFVNCSPSGMLDKTIFEAAASGCVTLAFSDDYARAAGAAYQFKGAEELAGKLVPLMSATVPADKNLDAFIQTQSLTTLADLLIKELLLKE